MVTANDSVPIATATGNARQTLTVTQRIINILSEKPVDKLTNALVACQCVRNTRRFYFTFAEDALYITKLSYRVLLLQSQQHFKYWIKAETATLTPVDIKCLKCFQKTLAPRVKCIDTSYCVTWRVPDVCCNTITDTVKLTTIIPLKPRHDTSTVVYGYIWTSFPSPDTLALTISCSVYFNHHCGIKHVYACSGCFRSLLCFSSTAQHWCDR